MTRFPNRIVLLLAFALAAASAWAQDPPARVGRLAYIENDVRLAVDRNQRGEPASINWPISSGAVVETGQRGRAEAWIGSTAYRLNERSRVEFSTIDDRRVDVRVDGGSLAVSVLDRDQAGDIAIATPDGVVRFATTGRYRIDVYADSTELSVLAGQASLDGHGRVQQVGPGQEAALYSDGHHSVGSNRDQDAFDLWVAERENATLAGPARRHVSPQMTGYSDLDAYGEWSSAPDYGTVWYPRGVADDWAPYRYGRWAWIDPWGWTWIDDAPWGFAPFHYGRWALVYGRWCWVPGAYVAAPIYAPALVAWVGSGGWSLSFGFGSGPAVGWFPLAPREVYVPSYRYSTTYIRQINVTQVRDVHYIDRAVHEGAKRQFAFRAQPQAVTVVPAQKLREGRPITRGDVRLAKPAELESAPRLHQAPGHEPQRERGGGAPRTSLFGGDGPRPGGERAHDFRQSQPERREVSRELFRSERPQPQRETETPRQQAPRELIRSERPQPQREMEAPRRDVPRELFRSERPQPQREIETPRQEAPRELFRSERPQPQREMEAPRPEAPREIFRSERPQPPREMEAPRREVPREIFRSERPQPQREIEVPRQREVPRPAPEMPRAAPEPQRPPPLFREAPRSEPPRMQAPQQPQGGGRERREERRDERGR